MHRPGSKADQRDENRRWARGFAFDVIRAHPHKAVPMFMFGTWVKKEIRRMAEGQSHYRVSGEGEEEKVYYFPEG